MSGGHFDYIQYRFDDVASGIEKEIATGEYEPAIVTRFQLAADTVRLAGKMIQRVDWLVSGDDGPDSFLTRWDDDGLPVPSATTLTAYHEHLAAAGSVVISVEWLEAVLAYANPIGPMGDHVFAEIRAMIAAQPNPAST